MTIRINQTVVDFTLESERTLADLVTSLEGWATANDLALLSVLADGQAFEATDARTLETIGELDIETVVRSAQEAASLAVVADYFALVAGAAARNPGSLTDLVKEYPAVRSALLALTGPLAERVSPILGTLDGPWSNPSELAAGARSIAEVAAARSAELTDPSGALASTFAALDQRLEALAELSQLFQRGKDRQAFEVILDLFTLLEDAHRRAGLLLARGSQSETAWLQAQADLQPFLRETQDALSAGDYILLTDLLEYEVIPRLVALRELFPGISKLDPVGDLP